ncbi:hypothetical protein RND71_006577 [Anisodus tanguticus]|uniref:AB hydrolase-1 domain-containing protein n=1 Tax=Anisodus tanguticus TaxID=243964 RepID=A0AAE1STM2_9SOLA|nr:hypothetical protein RND71_006577 [Anisodus tanguticus]
MEMLFKKIAASILSFLGYSDPQSNSRAELQRTVTSPRIRLKDGRYLAYRERGVTMNKSIHRIILVHGINSSKDKDFLATQEILEEMRIYMLQFDRAGYGESDQNPIRSLDSEASDIEELADQLQIGSKFYLISVSAGSYPAWNCLRRIPHRLTGVAFVVPIVNYKWNSLPHDLIKNDHANKLWRLVIWLARYAPGLLYSFFTQKSNGVLSGNPSLFSKKDIEVAKNANRLEVFDPKLYPKQSDFESLLQDFTLAYGKWDFDPLEFGNPFTENESSVHIWQGCEDKIVPCHLQRYVSKRLPWIHYHEVGDGGHALWHVGPVGEAILRSLLLGQDPYSPTI